MRRREPKPSSLKGWRSRDDVHIRRAMVVNVADILRRHRWGRSYAAPSGWVKRLYHIARELESHLYRDAFCLEAYKDFGTLEDRVQLFLERKSCVQIASTWKSGQSTAGFRWQSKDDFQDRQMMIRRIVDLILRRNSESKLRAPEDWLIRLPQTAKTLERFLYVTAPSKDVYNDVSTLRQRLLGVAEMNQEEGKQPDCRVSVIETTNGAS